MASETATSNQREHIHRCPICDRFRKIVRQKLESAFDEFRSLVDAESRRQDVLIRSKDVWRLRDALFQPFFQIDHALSATQTKRIQKMTKDEFKAHLSQDFVVSNVQPITPEIAVFRPRETERPKLTLLQGGKVTTRNIEAVL